MIPTWYFSSSKGSPDISQLNVTAPCPDSGCPLERKPLGHLGVGGQSQRLSSSRCYLPLGLCLHVPSPWSSVLRYGGEACTGPTTLLLSWWLPTEGHQFQEVNFFFTFEHPLKSACILQLMECHSSIGSVSFSLVPKIIVCHTIVVICQPLLKRQYGHSF